MALLSACWSLPLIGLLKIVMYPKVTELRLSKMPAPTGVFGAFRFTLRFHPEK
jgi:hypothetical protein